ncbi:tail fiber assembly protein [Citrobacter farmeri]|uniref:tail fiber assembly protein n=1 Tax=Citrobacter amalonaticus TaxID=35703 RepID=UPI0009BA0275|nr:tail fiber assembly protein [Citrobacter amalonaticus]
MFINRQVFFIGNVTKTLRFRVSDTEKVQYSLWLEYLDILEAVDTSNAPEIN